MKEGHEVIASNFWKFSNFQLKKILQEYWNTLLLIHESVDFPQIVEFLGRIPYPGKIAYISLTRTCDSIKPHIKDKNLKIFIIDCVSSQIFEKKSTQNCIFEPVPSNLIEMLGLINNTIQKVEPDIIVLDSLSQFIDLSSMPISKTRELHDFLDSLKEKYISTHYRFIILYDNILSKDLAQMPQTSVDVILKLEVIIGRIEWV